jgi:hypothetical protein
MLQTDLLWLKKSKKLIYDKIPKKWENPKKIFLIYQTKLNQVGFPRSGNTLNTMVKKLFTSETMRRVVN